MARLSRPPVQHFERLEARVVLASAVAGVGTGLIANYFSDPELKNLAVTRVDPAVNFDWGQGSPASGIPADGFSARWVGKVQAQFSETYTFYTNSDEGVALWVNGSKIIDNFTDHTLTEDSGTITLAAGETYNIRVDYYDNAFDASMQLSWSSDSTAKQIIPTSQLYPDAGWTGGAWLNADVGSPGAAGSVSSAGKTTFNVLGGGSGINNGSDQFQYLYQTLDGDGTLVAQVSSQDAGGQAGIMLRDSLDANSTFAALVTSTGGSPQFEVRGAVGGNVSTSSLGGGGKYWLKLVRDGNFLRGYASATGADGTWTYVGAQNISLDKTAYVGVFSSVSGGSGLDRAQFKSISINPVTPLGAGLDAVRDYSFGNVFVDAAKQARTYQGPNLGPTVATDSLGYPLADFMTIFATGFVNQGHLLNGTYHGSFTGQADLNTWLTPGGQIQNKSYDAGTNTTTFDLIVNAPESQDNWYIGMNFLNTRRDAGSGTNTGVSNIRLIRPGYDPNTTQVFSTQYLQFLTQFSVLRFMDWTQTNNSTAVDWADRTLPNAARQSSTRGVAWEYVVQLANQLHKDVWINIPAKASDDYVTQLAALMKNTLDPDRVVYVEYSNEVWNGIFSQYGDNLNAAVAEVNAGNSPLNADGETNQIYWGWRHTAKRLKEVSDIFASVWGQSAINGRVRPVLAAQHANPLVLQQGLEFIERTYGDPNKFFYGVAAAPYFGAASLDNAGNNATVDQFINTWTSSINNQKYFNFGSYAARYGLVNMAYEGGPDTSGGNNVAAKAAASNDPRMRELIKLYLNNWYKSGGGLFNWFVAGPTNWNTSNGSWGLSNQIDNLSSAKNQGTIDVATGARLLPTYGTAIPATFDARAIAGATQPYSTTYLKNPAKGASVDYFVRAPAAGTYQIIFNAATAGSNEQIRVAVNDSAVRTITLTNTGSATANFANNIVGTFTLQEGMNLIHLTAINVTSWNIQTVTVAPPPAATAPPTVANSAGASPTSINGKTTNLSVLGADDAGESSLVYSWEAIDEQPTSVTFSANGTNGAKNTTATFTRAGTYQLRVTISDGISSTTSTVSVTVNQVVTSVTIAPSGSVIANGETKQLFATAKDQFGVQLYAQPAFTWQVDNSFGSISGSGLYQGPASGLGSATVRATTGGVSGTTTVVTQSPRPADNPGSALAGIEYSYYEGTYTVLPNFDTLTPNKSGLLTNFSLSPAARTTNYAIQYTGYLYVPGTGTYTFYANSDDGSRVWVGGQLVVDNDGKHSAQEKSGSIILDQGWHQFKVGYLQGTGGSALTVSYAGPGLASKQAIPDANLERVDKAPTIATPASAVPNPITSTGTTLSVVGADESGESGLTYTWSTISAPSGAANPIFSVNGTNASKTSAATFFKAGAYTMQVSISDGTLATTTTINVNVSATVTSISVSPTNPSVRQNRTQQFAATARDQFGNVIASPPAFTWSAQANGGSIDANGLYTAPAAVVGNFAVSAAIGNISGSATVNVTADDAPTVATPASATPNPAPGTTTNLSVLGADDGGEANLIYTWATTALPGGATAPTFGVNGTNAAKNSTATFVQSGVYTLTVTISDGFKSVTSSVDVTVGTNTPTVATAASATPSPVTATTTNLSVLGNDAAGEANLTYTWATTGTPPAAVGFSSNGSNAAKNTTATFTKAGTYNFQVTIFNGQSSTTSNVAVVVNQTLTSITLAPTSASVVQSSNRQFTATAVDQFGATITSPGSYTWSVSSTGGAGTISQSGLYTAPSTGTPTDTVRATIGSVQGAATVNVTAASAIDQFGQSVDIGSPTLAGSYTFNGNAYTVLASGADTFGTSDQFQFVYKQLSGDGQIVARVASVQNTHSRAKAGVMFRETLTAGSKNVDLNIAPDKTATLQYRTNTGGGTSLQSAASSAAPYWVKVVRSGNSFSGFRSLDGVTWTQIGTSVSVPMNSTLYVGLALSSHDNTKLNTSVFDNVNVGALGALSGKAIGATPASISTSPAKLTDGNTNTYYQSADSNSAWVGLDFGSARSIMQIRFAPRAGYAAQMVGGKFQASNSADFSSGVTDLCTINAQPSSSGLTTISLPAAKAYRFVRYLAPAGSSGNIAESTFMGY